MTGAVVPLRREVESVPSIPGVIGFRFVSHFDVLAVLARFHKLVNGDPWDGKTDLFRMTGKDMPHRTLMLRCEENPSLETWMDELPIRNEPLYEKWPSLQRLIQRARIAVQTDPLGQFVDATAPVGRVVISVLQPRSVMAWHTDLGEYAKKHLRFHIALQTNPGALLYCNGESIHLPVGALVHLNALQQHCAANWGASLRSHLIFELPRRL